jgi:hypothetical protein
MAGGLAAFRSDGSALATRPTREITWVQLFDIDEDGISEVVTEEVDGRGTGVLQKTFRVYRVNAEEIREMWSGESLTRHAPDERHIEQSVGFLRFDGGGAGRNARLTHLLIDVSQNASQTIYEYHNGALQRVAASPR